jgi:hypothetical protein
LFWIQSAVAQVYIAPSTQTWGFNDEENRKLAEAATILSWENQPLQTRPLTIYPYNTTFDLIQHIAKAGPLPGASGGVWAYTYLNGIAYFTDLGMNQAPLNLSAILLHEADHHNVGRHTCGLYADTDDQGAYGSEAYFLARASRKEDYSWSLRASAQSRSSGIANFQMCGNAAARDRVLNGLCNGVFPVVPAPEPDSSHWLDLVNCIGCGG